MPGTRVVVPPPGAEALLVEGQVDDGVHQAVQGHQPEQRPQLLTNLLLKPAANNVSQAQESVTLVTVLIESIKSHDQIYSELVRHGNII